MAQNRFYTSERLSSGAIVQLPLTAATHAVRVLRMVVGDRCVVFNGDGYDYLCEIISIHKQHVKVKIGSSSIVETESPLNITLLQGISSGDRMDYTIQKAVELGVKHIQPINTDRSVVKLTGDRVEKRVLHWQGIANSACEQCGRAFVPKVSAPLTLSQWLSEHPLTTQSRILLNPEGAKRLAELNSPSEEIQLLIGAEGGLSPKEIEMATANNFQSVILGPRILRTETAALAAIASMHNQWGDF